MSGVEGLYVGLAVAGASISAGFLSAALAVGLAYVLRWLVRRDDIVDFALVAAVALLSVFMFMGCHEEVVAKGPHWWNCKNVVCHQVASRVDEARYMRSTKACECWIEDGRHLPQWIVIK